MLVISKVRRHAVKLAKKEQKKGSNIWNYEINSFIFAPALSSFGVGREKNKKTKK
jgi:hypothetical protein